MRGRRSTPRSSSRASGGTGDDGLLRAWEVRDRLRLDADLVTLSACESALGQEATAEGLIGLTRAFQHAGARSVVASLWAVTDRPTARFMESFYRRVRSGHATATARFRRPRSRACARASTLPLVRLPAGGRLALTRGNMAGSPRGPEAADDQGIGDQGMLRRFAFAAVLAAALTSSARARTTPPETVDLVAISRIRDEGFTRSQVMDTAQELTDVIGPRLTGLAGDEAGERVDAEAARRLGARERPASRTGDPSGAAGRSSARW